MCIRDRLSLTWESINYTIDCLFFVDILIIFNSATYNEDFELNEDRYDLAKNYVKSWFLLDIVAILPLDLMTNSGNVENFARYARIGRVTKMIKLIKLLRIMKLQKSSSFSILTWLQEFMQISGDLKWFFLFFCYFAMTTHVVACFWIITGTMTESHKSWTSSYLEGAAINSENRSDLYLTSVYFTITTITTVGYGDFSAGTFTERIVCMFIMLAGVIGFAMASGAVTNYIE